MSPAAPHPANPPPADRAASTRALTERQMAMLDRLAEIGMGIAEDAGRLSRAQAEGAGADGADPGLTFSRAARAVRLTIALQQRLTEGLAAFEQARTRARSVEAVGMRTRIRRRIERTAEAEGCDGDEVEQLSSDAWERLTDIEDDDILDLPMDEAVALICRDLGLSPAWAEAFAGRGLAGDDPLPPPAAPAGRATFPARAGEANDLRRRRFGGGAVAPDLSGVTEGALPPASPHPPAGPP